MSSLSKRSAAVGNVKHLASHPVQEPVNGKFVFTLVHVGPPNKPSLRVEKARAYTVFGAMSPYAGRRMTLEEVKARK